MWNSAAAWLRDVLSFPYREFEIDTQLSDEQVVERLRAIVEPGTFYFSAFKRTNKLFTGEVDRSAFKITLMKAWANSILVSVGRLDRSPTGTRIRITMRLTLYAQVFLVIWFGLLALPFLALVASIILPDSRRTQTLSDALSICGTLVAMAWAASFMVAIYFGIDARKARGLLEEALGAKPGPRVQRAIESEPRLTLRFWMLIVGLASSLIALPVFVRVALKRTRVQTVAYRVALDYLRANPVVAYELGAVRLIKLDRSTHSNLDITGTEGSASFALDIQGGHDQGIAFVHLKEHRSFWYVSAASLQESNGKIIELHSDAGSP